ncbi:MAG TPA: cation acetate symporter [Euzebya sp.]|nr:cation acetate symporter [Euzebya sp.]
MIAALLVLAVTLATVVVGVLGVRTARTLANFYVAARTVGPVWNAYAVCGEYLSAGTFLGLAGLVMVFGVDMLWFPVGYTAGYLVLLVFVAAPLRRFGAYTIPEFAQDRLESPRIRRVAAVFVLVIGWLYLLPQLKGAGIALQAIAGTPYWVGVVVVGAVVTMNIAAGGMRGITYVQAFQFWVMVVAISVPAIVLLGHWQQDDVPALGSDEPLRFASATTVEFERDLTIEAGSGLDMEVEGTIDGAAITGPTRIRGRHTIGSGTTVTFPRGAVIPAGAAQPILDGATWMRPLTGGPGSEHPVYFVYSIILATFLGTMGLPHILVRFYTNPDGVKARRTTLIVLGLLGLYYVWPPVYGALGRLYAPEVLVTGATDSIVLTLPERVFPGLLGQTLGGVVAAGAFAAFLSTASGLLISVTGAISHDVLRGGVGTFRRAAWAAGAVSIGLGLLAEPFHINVMVGWAFAIAASAFCPLLLLGIWWRQLSAAGAMAGLVAGGGLATAAIVTTMVLGPTRGWAGALLAAPAAWTVPLAMATAVAVSLRTPEAVPSRVGALFARMHEPEGIRARRLRATEPVRHPRPDVARETSALDELGGGV